MRQEHARQVSIHLNEMAGNIHSEADARALVDEVAEILHNELPPMWTSEDVRWRIAHAEFQAVFDPQKRIPERRVAEVWNSYVRRIRARDEALVTAAEIHNLRDALYVSVRYFWGIGENQSFWTSPNFFAVAADGRVADGCRALEALRILRELRTSFEGLRAARLRVQGGVLFSDEFKWRPGDAAIERRYMHLVRTPIEAEPVRLAEMAYMKKHGQRGVERQFGRLLDQLIPPPEDHR